MAVRRLESQGLDGRVLMSWRPPSAGPGDLDPGIDVFRERGGQRFRGDGTLVAEVYLQPQVCWSRHGWLWWKTWSGPVETVDASVLDVHGSITAEHFMWGKELDEEIQLWSGGTVDNGGEPFRVVWPDDDRSRVLRERTGLQTVEI